MTGRSGRGIKGVKTNSKQGEKNINKVALARVTRSLKASKKTKDNEGSCQNDRQPSNRKSKKVSKAKQSENSESASTSRRLTRSAKALSSNGNEASSSNNHPRRSEESTKTGEQSSGNGSWRTLGERKHFPGDDNHPSSSHAGGQTGSNIKFVKAIKYSALKIPAIILERNNKAAAREVLRRGKGKCPGLVRGKKLRGTFTIRNYTNNLLRGGFPEDVLANMVHSEQGYVIKLSGKILMDKDNKRKIIDYALDAWRGISDAVDEEDIIERQVCKAMTDLLYNTYRSYEDHEQRRQGIF